jgi:hypothetical protein
MVDIPFPQSSQPGFQPGEGQGRLLNRYFEQDGAIIEWKLVPGLLPFGDTGIAGTRGQIDVNGTLFVARNNNAGTMLPTGAWTTLVNPLPGSDFVSIAKNNRVPVDVVAVCKAGTYTLSTGGSNSVLPYPDGTLPDANSVCMLDGYFLFTIGDGHVYASGVNDIWIDDADHTQNALSNVMCDMSGGLIRGTTWAEQFFAFGVNAITVFVNNATYPFPLARTAIIPVGLKGAAAVTGFEPGWNLSQYFVATDNTVRRLDGYVATIISNRDVERAIAGVTDPTQIEMSCYVVGGRPTVVISGPAFTWEHTALTGNWNERQSPNQQRWRSSHSVWFAQQWIYGDILSTQLNRLSATTFDELGTSFTARLESGPVKQFPNRIRVSNAYFDFTSGQGLISGTPDQMDPSVWVSTSRDGGATWSTPVIREALGRQGQFLKLISVPRIGGIASQHGMRFRVDSSSPVYSSFRGARCDVQILGSP